MSKYYFLILLVCLISCKTGHHSVNGPGQSDLATVPIKDSTPWTLAMLDLKDVLTEISPYLFDSEKFYNRESHDYLSEKIYKLASTSKDISHSPTLKHRDPTVRIVASKFSDDLQWAQENYEGGKIDDARYTLMKVTSTCVQCHLRMQQGPEFSFIKTESLINRRSVIDRSEFLIATRRFNEAYDLLLKALSGGKESVTSGEYDRMLGLALQIATQYMQNPRKALAVIDKVQSNLNVPYFLKLKSRKWRWDILTWQKEQLMPFDITSLNKLIEDKSEIGAMRVIPKVLALLSTDLEQEQEAEALKLAGDSYQIINGILPFSLHEDYYQACIEKIPHTAFAETCYRALSDAIVINYLDKNEVRLPSDLETHLERLKKKAMRDK